MTDATPAPARTSRWMLVLVSALGATVLALSLVLAAVVSDRDDLRDELADQQEVAEVAGRFATAVSAFDHADLERSRQAVAALATEGFEAEYESALADLRPGLLESEVVMEPTVQDVHVGSRGAAQATAIVELDLTYRTSEGTFDIAGTFLLLNLVRTPEGWRVEGVESLRSGVDSRLSDLLPEQEDATGAEEPEPPG